MTLFCLMCQQAPRTESPYESPIGSGCRGCVRLDRTWSGGLTPPPRHPHLARTGSTRAPDPTRERRAGHRATACARVVPIEPRLVRSGGMRRDWSFEDLRNRAPLAAPAR